MGSARPCRDNTPLATVKKTCAPKCAVSLILVLSDDAKEPVRFVCDAGGEEDAVGEWQKIPQAIKLQLRAIGAHERLDESAGGRIINRSEERRVGKECRYRGSESREK